MVASDAVLFGELLNGVSTLGGAAKHRGGEDEEGKETAVPMPDRIQQSLVWSPGQVSLEDARALGPPRYFDGFASAQGDRGIVCIGSVKSNPVVDLVFR